MKRAGEFAISVFKYIIAGYMILAGAVTMVDSGDSTVSALGFIYNTRIGLIIVGLVVLTSGVVLLYGKLRKSKKWTGRGLFYVYLCFAFAAILNFVAYAGDWTFWLGNALSALVTGALWLRWKFKTEYINPNHFKNL